MVPVQYDALLVQGGEGRFEGGYCSDILPEQIRARIRVRGKKIVATRVVLEDLCDLFVGKTGRPCPVAHLVLRPSVDGSALPRGCRYVCSGRYLGSGCWWRSGWW